MKSIYDEVTDIIVDSLIDPQDEDNNCYMFDRKQINKIARAIRKAQKQGQLLELYEELSSVRLHILKETDVNNKNALLNKDIVISKTIEGLENEKE